MNPGLESLGRVRRQGIALLVVVFAIGALGGAAAMRALERASALPPGPPPAGPPGGEAPGTGLGPGAYPALLTHELGLSERQREQLHEILERHRPTTEKVMNEFLPRVRAVEDTVRSEIRAMLTPAQQKRFDEIEPRAVELMPPPPEGPPGAPPERMPGVRPGGPPLRHPR
jgi:hypothetical protein